jgi:hypothetical protein
VDIARGELVEAELDAMIRRRDTERRKSEGERLEEVLWAESERRYTRRQREQNRWEWVRYFDRMARNHARLSEEYERRAEELCEENGRSRGTR